VGDPARVQGGLNEEGNEEGRAEEEGRQEGEEEVSRRYGDS
jgi:hypothetical protein